MHIGTIRLRVLKFGAKVARHARNITIHACSPVLPAGQRFLSHFKQLHWLQLPAPRTFPAQSTGAVPSRQGSVETFGITARKNRAQRARKPDLTVQ